MWRTAPAWWSTYSAETDPWAPDISHERGKYLMYYAVSSFGSNHSAIGLATSRTGRPGSWTDRGIVYATELGMDHNAIDPNLLVDREGRWWLSFGSYWTGRGAGHRQARPLLLPVRLLRPLLRRP